MPFVQYGPPYPPIEGVAYEAISPAPNGMPPMVRGTGDTPEEAAQAYTELWEQQPGRDPQDPIEFVRLTRVHAEEAYVLGVGWRIRANPGDPEQTVEVTAADRDSAEAEFRETWNAARGTAFTVDDFAFDRLG